ncbi:MAG: hypothetical protein J0I65_24375 [Variovorax sp.]|jgi:hypothetical protein|uniref:hypothetical protein n=1 Tax=Sphingomonas sp. TaxID=28214 RepID=UPI0010F9F60E|nr:hypothetical protein [Sphingomonas sp.]MBN8750614.1 hypothetical protein [Variovorax sp.]|tara:strand:- start:561 stop:1025 length:465 start_codon:yes stop_codon:yes gene_type:complete
MNDDLKNRMTAAFVQYGQAAHGDGPRSTLDAASSEALHAAFWDLADLELLPGLQRIKEAIQHHGLEAGLHLHRTPGARGSGFAFWFRDPRRTPQGQEAMLEVQYDLSNVVVSTRIPFMHDVHRAQQSVELGGVNSRMVDEIVVQMIERYLATVP